MPLLQTRLLLFCFHACNFVYFIMHVGPKPETVSDFWQMIVEHKTSVVVMLTKVDEGGKVRCENCECVLLFCLLLCIWSQVW